MCPIGLSDVSAAGTCGQGDGTGVKPWCSWGFNLAASVGRLFDLAHSSVAKPPQL